MTLKTLTMALVAATTMATAGGTVVPAQEEVAPITKDFYVGVNGQATIATASISDTFDSVAWDNAKYGVGLQAGYVFYRAGNFSTALEGRYTYAWDDAKNLSYDSLDSYDTGIVSGFVKPAYDFGPVTGYALLGYSHVDVDNIGTTDGFAWGLGVSGDVTDSLELFVDVTVNPNFDNNLDEILVDVDHEVITFGINYKF